MNQPSIRNLRQGPRRLCRQAIAFVQGLAGGSVPLLKTRLHSSGVSRKRFKKYEVAPRLGARTVERRLRQALRQGSVSLETQL